jgi:hypothetical protein
LPDHGNTLTGDVISVTIPMAHSGRGGDSSIKVQSCSGHPHAPC